MITSPYPMHETAYMRVVMALSFLMLFFLFRRVLKVQNSRVSSPEGRHSRLLTLKYAAELFSFHCISVIKCYYNLESSLHLHVEFLSVS